LSRPQPDWLPVVLGRPAVLPLTPPVDELLPPPLEQPHDLPLPPPLLLTPVSTEPGEVQFTGDREIAAEGLVDLGGHGGGATSVPGR